MSYVNLIGMQLHNESGLFPPMSYAFSGVPGCAHAQGCGRADQHFTATAQLMFSLTAPPTAVHLQEGVVTGRVGVSGKWCGDPSQPVVSMCESELSTGGVLVNARGEKRYGIRTVRGIPGAVSTNYFARAWCDAEVDTWGRRLRDVFLLGVC